MSLFKSRLIFNTIIMFVFIYPLRFTFFPLSTRYILAGIGILYMMGRRSLLSKYLTGVFRFMPVLFFSLLTCVVNATTDLGLWSTPIVYSVSFFASVGVIGVTKSYEPRKFIELFIIAVVIQMSICILFFVLPEVEEAANSFIVSSELAKEAMEDSIGIRMRGLGAAFFSCGVINCIALLLISLFYTPEKKIYFVAYSLIFLIGIFVSRTTLVGVLLSAPILLKKLQVSFKKVIIGICLLFTGFYYVGTTLKNSEEQKYLNLFNFGFALINNYEDTESFNTRDIDALSYSGRMPDNIKTWIIGDGLLADPRNPERAYYKHVDQGYLRCLYFFGLLGTASLLVGYYLEIREVVRSNKNKWFYLLFLFYMIIMYKGLMDIFQFIIPFYLIYSIRDLSILQRKHMIA